MLTTTLRYDVPVPVAFDYLADPRHRPEWQSSLRSVELLDEAGHEAGHEVGDEVGPHVGMRWVDHTAVGMAPRMEITALEPGVLWAESGRWRAIEADLTLRFAPHRGGCSVDVEFEVRGRRYLRPVGWAASRAGLLAVRSDLRRAGRILQARHSPGTAA